MDNPFAKPLEIKPLDLEVKPEEVANVENITEANPMVEEEKVTTKLPVLNAKQQILKDYGGNESDVPINSPYWKLKG